MSIEKMLDVAIGNYISTRSNKQAFIIVNGSNLFDDAVLKPSGITMEQYQLMQKHTNELQDAIAIKLKNVTDQHFNSEPDLTSIRVHFPILHLKGEHELVNHIHLYKGPNNSTKVTSRIGRDESYVGLSAEVIKLYEEINN